jgi:GTPase SAR1 family protein
MSRFELNFDQQQETSNLTESQQQQQKEHTPMEVEGAEEAGGTTKSNKKVPTVVVVIGMAGAGKTTLMHRINLHMVENNISGYYINLDPAVRDVPFGANIDIRDTVNYKEVMKQYGLGPNGGILTSLNLFATRFDQVIQLLEKRASDLDYIFIDTPGQIETFTWSAGGQIILDLLASSFPTVIAYVTDAIRCVNPTTFMSNMLYASSVLYKSQLPLITVFNKTDIARSDTYMRWMKDFESFQEAIDRQTYLDEEGQVQYKDEATDVYSQSQISRKDEYMSSLNRSLSLAMDEFYRYVT